MAPGSQTFEQDLFRLYKETVITLDEALANADSPTNLSWLINNSEFGNEKREDKRAESPLNFGSEGESGPSFKEFTLSLSDSEEDETKDAS